MSWRNVMNRVLPPTEGGIGISPHVTSEYGAAAGRKYPASIPHGGVDFNYAVGQNGINLLHPPVFAPVSGTVTNSGGSYGIIAIRDVNGLSHEILHTDTQSVRAGQKVFAGKDVIGTMGKTRADNQHVHYQLKDRKGKTLDPALFWNQQSGLPQEYRQYQDITGANTGSEPNNSPAGDLPASFNDRFGNWTSSSAVIPPRGPNQPASPEPDRPGGSVASKPASIWNTPLPIFDFSDRSGALPAPPPAASGDPNFPGGLAGWIATLAGIDPSNPDQPAPANRALRRF